MIDNEIPENESIPKKLGPPTYSLDDDKAAIPLTKSDLRNDLSVTDELKWKEWARKFGLFFGELKEIFISWAIPDSENTSRIRMNDLDKEAFYRLLSRRVVISLQALFLGEKPAILDLYDKSTSLQDKEKEAINELLIKYGFSIDARFVYNPDMLRNAMVKYFQGWDKMDIKKALTYLDQQDKAWWKKPLETGLVLGFPLDSCRWLTERKRLIMKIMSLDTSGVVNQLYNNALAKWYCLEEYGNIANAYRYYDSLPGRDQENQYPLIEDTSLQKPMKQLYELEKGRLDFVKQIGELDSYGPRFWQYNAGEETIAYKKRMKQAFETSGILDIWDTHART